MEQSTPNVAPDTSTNLPTTNAPKKSKKGLIIGLICGGVAFAALIVTVILLVVLNRGVSREDYRSAHRIAMDLARTIEDSNSRIESMMINAESMTQEDLDEIKSEIIDVQEKLLSGIRALGDENAIRRDDEANRKFRALEQANRDFSRDMDLLIEVYEQAMPVFVEMINVGEKFMQIDDEDQVHDLIAELRNLANSALEVDLSSSAINFAMHDMGDAMYLMADILQLAIDEDEDDMDALLLAIEALELASEDLVAELEKLADSGQNLSDRLDDLGRYLTDQANR